jgi:hypothetical protein
VRDRLVKKTRLMYIFNKVRIGFERCRWQAKYADIRRHFGVHFAINSSTVDFAKLHK